MFGFAPHAARRLVLVSDGNQTQGDLWRALPRLQAEGMRVFTIPAAVSVDDDAWVDSIAVPEGVREQEPVTVSGACVLAQRSRARACSFASGERRPCDAHAARCNPGENEIALAVRFPRTGSHAADGSRSRPSGDQDARNDALSESVWVGPRPRVLYVESAPESAHYLAEALRAQHIDVTVATAEALRSDPACSPARMPSS